MTCSPGDVIEITIEQVGRHGDGIARQEGGKIFVPLTAPGDRVRVRLTERRADGFAGVVVTSVEVAPRAEPPCRHFGICGGCQLQHLLPADDLAWQREQVIAALAQRGLSGMPVAMPVAATPGERRRARLAFTRRDGSVQLGFRRRRGRQIVDLAMCPLLRPEIVQLFPFLRTLLGQIAMARRGGAVLATATDAGVDLLLDTQGEPALADREALAAFAETHDLARLAWRPDSAALPEPIVQRRPVAVQCDGVAVDLPPGAFLQASDAAEAAICKAAHDAIGDAARLADLYAGCGMLSLPLAAAGRHVVAIEANEAMTEALLQAAQRAGFGARVRAEVRDLEGRPLAGAELARLDAVIVDPPRRGARSQAEALAGSKVGRIALVSCNPATFARDARILVDGGYDLTWVQVIDAFLWSSEIELVGAFARL